MRVLALIIFWLVSLSVSAGSVDSGIAPYERCALCHGLFGNTPRSKFPKLAGQNPKYLEQQINLFLTGERTNDGGQMATVVTEIAVSDIPEIVNWFAMQDAPQPYDTQDNLGETLFSNSGCMSCHNEQTGSDELMPLLSAQHPQYLAKQMRELRDGYRTAKNAALMGTQLQALSNSDIEAIANHLASMSRPQ